MWKRGTWVEERGRPRRGGEKPGAKDKKKACYAGGMGKLLELFRDCMDGEGGAKTRTGKGEIS